jgi:hypothetical protein
MLCLTLLLSLAATAGCKSDRDRNSAGDETRGKAVSVPLGMVVTDQISATFGDHTDWKSFAVPAPGVLAVRVYWDASDKVKDAVVTVHDKYGVQLAERLHDPNVAIDELLVRVDQGFYYVKVAAERGESIYSIQGQHLLVAPSNEGDDEGSIPMMASALDIQLPGPAAAGADAAALQPPPAAGGGGAATPNLAFIDDSNLGFLVPPDIDPEEAYVPRRAAPTTAPPPPPTAPPPPPPPPPTAPPPMAVPATPAPAPPPPARMDAFSEPTGERSMLVGSGSAVGFGAGLDGPADPPPAPPPRAAKPVETVEAKILLSEAAGSGTRLILRCADDRVSEGQRIEVFDSLNRSIDVFTIETVDGTRCTTSSNRPTDDFVSPGRVVIYIP